MILYQLRHAVRRLSREPGFTSAALLTLALGVGLNVAVFAVVEAVLLRPLPYPDSEQLVVLNHRDRQTGITKEFIAIGDYADLAERQKSFSSLVGYGDMSATIFGMGDPFRVSAVMAGGDLLGTLGVPPALGRTIQASDAKPGAAPVAMLGYDLWTTRFGADPNVIGRGVTIGQETRQIVGVAPRGFRFPPTAAADVILSMEMPIQAPVGRRSGWTFVVGRLKPGIALADAATNLSSISRQLETEYPTSNLATEYFPIPLRDALVGSTKTALTLMLAAVAAVLLIACANVTNLLLARSVGRRREMAVRTALGASRGRLVGQFVAEMSVLAVTAGVVGTIIAYWGAHALLALVPRSVSVPGISDVRINGTVAIYAFAISVGTALVCGLVSATSLRTGGALSGLLTPARAGISRAARRAAAGLVVVEIAMAIVLLVGAGLMLRSFASLLGVNPGFQPENVMTIGMSLPADRYRDSTARQAFYQQAFASLTSLEPVEQVGAAAVVPLTGNNWSVPFDRADKPVPAGERPPDVGWQLASAGFFTSLHIPLLSGRLFDTHDGPTSKPVVIVSEAIQKRFFGEESAVGHEIALGNQRLEIVGVVGNIRRAALSDQPRADMYFPFERATPTQTTLFIRTRTDPVQALPLLQSTLRGIEPNIVLFDMGSLSSIAGESLRVTQLILWLLGVFAVTALALAAVGVYGVMSYVVRQQTREIGTRVALGASRQDILRLVMRQGALIAAIGTGGGLVVGLLAAKSLQSVLFGVRSYDPVTLLGAAALLAATTIVACYLPARRASTIDPAKTLVET